MMDSSAHGLYVDGHQVSKVSVGRADFWVVKHIFKFPAETCSDPVERQPDQKVVTPVHLLKGDTILKLFWKDEAPGLSNDAQF